MTDPPASSKNKKTTKRTRQAPKQESVPGPYQRTAEKASKEQEVREPASPGSSESTPAQAQVPPSSTTTGQTPETLAADAQRVADSRTCFKRTGTEIPEKFLPDPSNIARPGAKRRKGARVVFWWPGAESSHRHADFQSTKPERKT